MKLTAVFIAMFLSLASVASSEVLYDAVRVAVEPGVACPSSWTASTETVTIPTLYIVQAPAILGGRAIRVSPRFVNAVWPSAADKATATTTGLLVIEAGSTAEVNYCDLLP